jgi:hypothetical protein
MVSIPAWDDLLKYGRKAVPPDQFGRVPRRSTATKCGSPLRPRRALMERADIL